MDVRWKDESAIRSHPGCASSRLLLHLPDLCRGLQVTLHARGNCSMCTVDTQNNRVRKCNIRKPMAENTVRLVGTHFAVSKSFGVPKFRPRRGGGHPPGLKPRVVELLATVNASRLLLLAASSMLKYVLTFWMACHHGTWPSRLGWEGLPKPFKLWQPSVRKSRLFFALANAFLQSLPCRRARRTSSPMGRSKSSDVHTIVSCRRPGKPASSRCDPSCYHVPIATVRDRCPKLERRGHPICEAKIPRMNPEIRSTDSTLSRA
mmetsp:Transcript_35585/g.75890  ORF Transcript_35585/g.75890 Transcript_35585/m.75890 type:complete len:262 (-) Transcript_35585:773-1558(-)